MVVEFSVLDVSDGLDCVFTFCTVRFFYQFLYWPKRIDLNLFHNEHAIYVFFLSIGGSAVLLVSSSFLLSH